MSNATPLLQEFSEPCRPSETTSNISMFHRRDSTKRLLQAAFTLLGIGVLVPWNAFISALAYLQSRLCSSPTLQEVDIESTLAMLFNISSVLTLVVILLLQSWDDGHPRQYDENEQNDARARGFWHVILPLAVAVVVFGIQTFLVLDIGMDARVFWRITLSGVIVCGMVSAVANAGIVATAGLLGPLVAMNPFLAGQSVGGVLVSLANAAAAYMEDPQVFWKTHCTNPTTTTTTDRASSCTVYIHRDWAVFYYFLLGTLILVACVIAYVYIDRYQRKANDLYETVQESPRIGLEMLPHTNSDLNLLEQDESGLDENREENDPSSLPCASTENETTAVWRMIHYEVLTIFLVFFVTLSLFPGWISQLRSAHQCTSTWRLFNDMYTPTSFILFNVGDLTGRLFAGKVPLSVLTPKLLVAGALARFLLFPLIAMCAVGARSDWTIDSDLYSWTMQWLLAVSNGFLVSLAFCNAPLRIPPTSHLHERASELMTLSLALGLLSGSVCSLVVITPLMRWLS